MNCLVFLVVSNFSYYFIFSLFKIGGTSDDSTNTTMFFFPKDMD